MSQVAAPAPACTRGGWSERLGRPGPALVAADRCRDSARRPPPFLFGEKERKQRKALANSFYVTLIDCDGHRAVRTRPPGGLGQGGDFLPACQPATPSRQPGLLCCLAAWAWLLGLGCLGWAAWLTGGGGMAVDQPALVDPFPASSPGIRGSGGSGVGGVRAHRWLNLAEPPHTFQCIQPGRPGPMKPNRYPATLRIWISSLPSVMR